MNEEGEITLRASYLKRMTPIQFLVLSYLLAMFLSASLLMLPVSWQPGVQLSWREALFTATSGISVTGLTVVNLSETFSVFGAIVIMFMMQFGGIGIMALGTFLWLILGRDISLSYRRLIMADQNQHNLSGLVKLMKSIFLLSLLFEGIGALLLGTYFLAAGYYTDPFLAYFHALFHALSSYTNAGFDLFGNSLQTFSGDYFVQTVTMLLLFLGAIGFPVLIEAREWFVRRGETFRFSLYTKVTVSMYVILLVLGAAGIWIVESRVSLEGMPWHKQLFYSLFNSITTRSGGLSTMDVNGLSSPTQYLLSILMFIGASPSSVGGGIRTTTFAVIMLTLATYARGRNEVRIFKRSIKQEDILKSFIVFSTAVILVCGSVMLLDAVERQRFSLNQIIFEVCSALGTSGLSTGVTPDLSIPGQVLLMALMFVGRIGILSMLLLFRSHKRKDRYHYVKEDLIIG